MKWEEYRALDATALAALIRSGELSAEEAVETAIEASERVNPSLNAIRTKAYEYGRERARKPQGGGFSGVPTFVKDTDDLVGYPTLFGSAALPGWPAATSSEFVHQFESTGVAPLGKTSTPEMGLCATTECLAQGPTRNPWDLDRSPGGSSGGSAAMVATGVVPIAHANDGGGSIRIPASCCGLVGLKPSQGRVAGMAGTEKIPVQFAVNGVLSRTVRDTAGFFAAAEEFTPRAALEPIGKVEGPSGERLRIAFFIDSEKHRSPHPEWTAAVRRSAAVCKDLGHEVREIASPFHPSTTDDFLLVWGIGPSMLRLAGRPLAGMPLSGKKLEPLTRGLIRHFWRHLHLLPGAMRRLRAYPQHYAELHRDFDVLLSPVLSGPPPKLGEMAPDQPFDEVFGPMLNFAAYTIVQNVAHVPAISLPLAHSEAGHPIGVQFASGVGQERRLLELAYELESAMPWADRRPEAPSSPN
jgi:amidase